MLSIHPKVRLTLIVELYIIGLPPWILKPVGLETSGQRLISLKIKTRRIGFFLFKKTSFFSSDFFIFCIFLLTFWVELGFGREAGI